MEIENKLVIADDVVITLKYSVSVADQVVESSADDSPIQFIQGRGDVIPGLENALYGLSVGDQKEFNVAPEDGYGEVDPDAIAKIPKAEFPPEIPLQPGVELRLKDEQGDELEAQIVAVEDEIVRLNFNHPLAGKELLFAVQVLDIRQATPEELEHGHVHSNN